MFVIEIDDFFGVDRNVFIIAKHTMNIEQINKHKKKLFSLCGLLGGLLLCLDLCNGFGHCSLGMLKFNINEEVNLILETSSLNIILEK